MSTPYDNVRNEYWYNVSDQHEMPIVASDEQSFDVRKLGRFLRKAAKCGTDAELAKLTASEIEQDKELFRLLRQMLGISNKRAYLELSYLVNRTPHPTKQTSLDGKQPWTFVRHSMPYFENMISPKRNSVVRAAASKMMSEFLIRNNLKLVIGKFSKLSNTALHSVFEVLVASRESQQPAAKRRGHGCERELAYVIQATGVSLLPHDKVLNPMGAHDPNLDKKTLELVATGQGETYSVDMLVLEGDQVRIAIQSLVHTSDPGQFGTDKSKQTNEIKIQVSQVNKQPDRADCPIELWGLVDGVGFSEKKKVLNKMLDVFDCFIQLNTLYKAPLRLHELGLCQVAAIQFSSQYKPQDIEAITSLYVPKDVEVLEASATFGGAGKEIPAGLATIFMS